MTVITVKDGVITCDGHAGDKICCAMLTALTYSVIENLERLNQPLLYEYDNKKGYSRIDVRDVDDKYSELVNSYVYSLMCISKSYPENVKIV